jgi:hypothetical protein
VPVSYSVGRTPPFPNCIDSRVTFSFVFFIIFLPRSLSDFLIDDPGEGSSHLKVPSVSIQLFVEGNQVLPYTFYLYTVG